MDITDLTIDHFGRVRGLLARCIEGLTVEQLMQQPDPESNPLGWNGWHLTRVQDHEISNLAGREQAWIEDGWHERFGMPADPDAMGVGDSMDQVRAFQSPEASVILDYYDAVYARTQEYLRTITPEALDRVLNEPRWDPMPTVGVRLVSVMNDCSMHAGEMAYLRGMLERRQWYPA